MKWYWKFVDSEDEPEFEDDSDFDSNDGWWYGYQSPWLDKNEILPRLWQRVFVVIGNGTVYNTMYCGEPAADWRFGGSDILYWMPEPDTGGLAGINDSE